MMLGTTNIKRISVFVKFEGRAFVVVMEEGFSEIHCSGCDTYQQSYAREGSDAVLDTCLACLCDVRFWAVDRKS